MIGQPRPIPNRHPSIPSLVIDDLDQATHLGALRHAVADRVRERQQVGIARYGTSLQPYNGRDALRDLAEEILDGAQYARQLVVELEHDNPGHPDLPRLRAMYTDLLDMACAIEQMRADRGQVDAAARTACIGESLA